MSNLKPMRTQEEAAAVPADEPVLIELTPEQAATPPTQTVSVETAPEPKPAPKPEPVAEPEPESPLQKQLDALKQAEAEARRQLAESQQREAAAINAANQRGEELHQVRGEREQAQYDAVLNALGAAQAEADRAQNDLAAALAAQDYQQAAEAQRRLSVATTRQIQLEDGKVAFEGRQEQPRAEPLRQVPADPIDGMTHLSVRQRTWLKSHRDAQTEPAKLARLGAAHWDAIEAGHAQDSDGYFQVLEERLGYRKSAPAESEYEPEPQRRSMPVSAPVSRDSPSLSTGRATPTRVQLTPEQRDAARISNIDDVTYARNLLKLQEMKKQGHYQERG